MTTPIPLVRDALRTPIRNANDVHPGWLIQRGWPDFVKTDSENAGLNGKTEHIKRICDLPAPELYQRAYERWLNATSASNRFVHLALKIDGRLLIGLTGGGALETGCAVSHTWGMPYIPGSSIKGVLRAWAQKKLGSTSPAVLEVFGSEPTEDEKQGLSGLVAFHDAWWIPDSAPHPDRNKPFVEDVVTPHHSDYYREEGATPATDLDSPVPNAMIGVHGSFLFTLEGPIEWLNFTRSLFGMAISDIAMGAKTRAGYGYFKLPEASALQSTQSSFAPAKLGWDVGRQELKAVLVGAGKAIAPVKGAAAQTLLDKLPEDIRKGKKLKEGNLLVDVIVRTTANMLELVDIKLPSSN